jgi:hypothetical protein
VLFQSSANAFAYPKDVSFFRQNRVLSFNFCFFQLISSHFIIFQLTLFHILTICNINHEKLVEYSLTIHML